MADIKLKYLTDLEVATSVASADLFHINQGGLDKSISYNVLTAALMDYFAPIGTVMFRSDTGNPNTMFPGTIWAKLTANATIRTAAETGVDVMKTAGSDSATLAVANLPSHSHDFTNGTAASNGAHTHTLSGTAASAGAHTHTLSGTAASNGAHTHSVSGTAASAGAHTHAQGAWRSSGGSSGTYIDRNVFNNAGQRDTSSYTESAGAHTHSVSGTAASAGAHSHTISGTAANAGAHTHTISGTAASAGAHTHSVSGTISNTGSGSAFSTVNYHLKLVGWRRTS